METILLAIVLMLVIFAAMAIGILFGRSPIKGSCGGMSALAGEPDCPICGGDTAKCEASSMPSSPASQPESTVRRFDPGEPR